MMIGLSGGLGITVGPQSGDQCLNMSTYQVEPCVNNAAQDLCFDPNSNQHGSCGSMPGAIQVPVLTLGDILQRCSTPQCQVVSAVPPGSQACDPLIRAAGYDCQTVGGGLLNIWSKANLVNGQLYTSDQGVIPAPSANQYGLTPAQTSYLIQTGIIQPVTSMNQTILPIANAAPPTSGPGAPGAVIAQYISSGIPSAAALPPPTTILQAVPMTPGYSTPTTVALGTGTPIYSQVPAGTIPGANTAAAGPGAYASQPAASDGNLLPGVPNNYLYIGAAALLALLVLKK